MAKATFPETTGQESLKPTSTISDSDLRNAISALFQMDLSPLRAKAQSTPNMTVQVNPAEDNSFNAHVWKDSAQPMTYAGGNSSAISAPTTNPRIDILVLQSNGTLAWVTGAENASPVPNWASIPSQSIPICLVYCKTTMDRILAYDDKDSDTTEGYVYKDIRPFLNLGGGTFQTLSDTPDSYTGKAGYVPIVNLAETALEFYNLNKTRDNIALLAFRMATADGLSLQGMVDGFVDEYEDQSGVDTGGSTNTSYDTTDDYHYPTKTGGGIDSNARLVLLMNGSAASFVDSETTPKTITPSGSATQIPYKFNKSAMFFDGSSYVRVPDSTDWDYGSGNFTLECWFMSTGGFVASLITSGDSYSGDGVRLSLGSSTSIDVTIDANSYSRTVSAMSAFVWYHIAVSRNGSTVKVFLDGVQAGADITDSSTISGSTTGVTVGANHVGGANFTGWIKEVRISNSARYTAGFTPSSSQFTSDSNTKLLLHGDTPASAPISPCIKFDGTGDYLSVADHADWDFGTGDFTLEAWVKFKTLTQAYIFSRNNGSSNVCDLIWNNSGPYWTVYINSVAIFNISTPAPVINRWYHVASVRSGTSVKLYLDGVEIGSGTSSANISDTLGYNIGAYTSAVALLDGYLKNVRISNVARYTSRFTPSQTPFEADANTKLLILATESNGVTTFVDSETTPKTITTNGNCVIVYEEDYRNTIFKDDGNTGHKPYGLATAKPKIDFVCPFGSGVAKFAATGDYITTPDHADFHPGTGAFTIEGWFRYITVGNHAVWDSSGTAASNGIFCSYFSGALKLYLNASAALATYNFTPVTNTWYHYEFTRDGSSNLKIFVNGSVGATGTSSANVTAGQTVRLPNYTPSYDGFVGLVDNVRYSNTARHTAVFNPPNSEWDSGTPQNMTMKSQAQTAEATPSQARIVLFEQDVDAITINTHLMADVSRDGGTTWTQIALADLGDYESGKRILAGTVDISAQPSGTSMKYRLRTANNKDLKLHGVALAWD